ncbi:hypothetical protein GQ53DRAFT_754827 [Thozetella sp. PMI_491]|nr:hypothetical protein GQ53DRAFT_754827 [Thozetella sp. PMI_491]
MPRPKGPSWHQSHLVRTSHRSHRAWESVAQLLQDGALLRHTSTHHKRPQLVIGMAGGRGHVILPLQHGPSPAGLYFLHDGSTLAMPCTFPPPPHFTTWEGVNLAHVQSPGVAPCPHQTPFPRWPLGSPIPGDQSPDLRARPREACQHWPPSASVWKGCVSPGSTIDCISPQDDARCQRHSEMLSTAESCNRHWVGPSKQRATGTSPREKSGARHRVISFLQCRGGKWRRGQTDFLYALARLPAYILLPMGSAVSPPAHRDITRIAVTEKISSPKGTLSDVNSRGKQSAICMFTASLLPLHTMSHIVQAQREKAPRRFLSGRCYQTTADRSTDRVTSGLGASEAKASNPHSD